MGGYAGRRCGSLKDSQVLLRNITSVSPGGTQPAGKGGRKGGREGGREGTIEGEGRRVELCCILDT